MRRIKYWLLHKKWNIKYKLWQLSLRLKFRKEPYKPKPKREGKPVVYIRWKNFEEKRKENYTGELPEDAPLIDDYDCLQRIEVTEEEQKDDQGI